MTMYDAAYFRMREDTAWHRNQAYLQEYQRINDRLCIRRGNVLDYGCGTGDFLELFRRDYWHVAGVEVSQYCLQVMADKRIEAVYVRLLDDATLDLVVFRGVLQHLDDPFEALRQARRLLVPGGMLAILAQPDADSLCYKLFGELPALDPPRNWWIPGRRELVNVLNNLDFKNIEVLHPYWGGPYANPPRDFARFAGRLFGIRRPFAFPGNMMEVYATC